MPYGDSVTGLGVSVSGAVVVGITDGVPLAEMSGLVEVGYALGLYDAISPPLMSGSLLPLKISVNMKTAPAAMSSTTMPITIGIHFLDFTLSSP